MVLLPGRRQTCPINNGAFPELPKNEPGIGRTTKERPRAENSGFVCVRTLVCVYVCVSPVVGTREVVHACTRGARIAVANCPTTVVWFGVGRSALPHSSANVHTIYTHVRGERPMTERFPRA